MKSMLAAVLALCAAPYASAKNVAYVFQGSTSGVEIEQDQPSGGLDSGFTFDAGCSNEQQVIWIHTKASKGMIWSYTATDPTQPGWVFAYVINETTLTWSIFGESMEYSIPLELINSGQLQKTKPCAVDTSHTITTPYLQRLTAAGLLNRRPH
jgi:hypothetical protein